MDGHMNKSHIFENDANVNYNLLRMFIEFKISSEKSPC